MGGYTRAQLQEQYDRFKTYAHEGVITAASMLLYGINEEGKMTWWDTSEPSWSIKKFQQDMGELGLKKVPLFFCDSTIGNCSPLGPILQAVYDRQEAFISESLQEASAYGWDGYAIDFEAFGFIDSKKLMSFTCKWAEALDKAGLHLMVWTGGPTFYDLEGLSACKGVSSAVTMDSYGISSSSGFSSFAERYMQSVPGHRAGFGILVPPQRLPEGLRAQVDREMTGKWLTVASMGGFSDSLTSAESVLMTPGKESDEEVFGDSFMDDVGGWCHERGVESLGLWASYVPPEWYNGLRSFLSTDRAEQEGRKTEGGDGLSERVHYV
uniref:GH18 domain-containing protein n=1 Tax=Chromera velia CCMP2878 TaxID=1169474 RepID=A0A0G4HCZ3_9ALVE|eukprot:Cvel_26374.t1-p1 / transcript=Cvel_26374.t1 / gene=Cvel_26374 / organism=Chromera_velia_CCMP2878 / gene_product=hypothetical protein / transcript_product=hypothetical protein / location=Cvel_scaffold3125:13158-14126(+) / protein_length=323 / sequence_SO=supercontig / SO=protein_coding / is_pseudo=false